MAKRPRLLTGQKMTSRRSPHLRVDMFHNKQQAVTKVDPLARLTSNNDARPFLFNLAALHELMPSHNPTTVNNSFAQHPSTQSFEPNSKTNPRNQTQTNLQPTSNPFFNTITNLNLITN
ncbi:hypothetical protein Droror1_Dr00015514 [Drosera rotundifolia]